MADNPPAFPSGDKTAFPASTFEAGMSLRDYFAGQALNVIGGMYACGDAEIRDSFEVANMAYSLADAMLAERVASK